MSTMALAISKNSGKSERMDSSIGKNLPKPTLKLVNFDKLHSLDAPTLQDYIGDFWKYSRGDREIIDKSSRDYLNQVRVMKPILLNVVSDAAKYEQNLERVVTSEITIREMEDSIASIRNHVQRTEVEKLFKSYLWFRREMAIFVINLTYYDTYINSALIVSTLSCDQPEIAKSVMSLFQSQLKLYQKVQEATDETVESSQRLLTLSEANGDAIIDRLESGKMQLSCLKTKELALVVQDIKDNVEILKNNW